MKNRKLFCEQDCLHSGSNQTSDRFRPVGGLTIIRAAKRQVQLQVVIRPCTWNACLQRLMKTCDTSFFPFRALEATQGHHILSLILLINNWGYVLDTGGENARIRIHQRPPRTNLSLLTKIQHDYTFSSLSGTIYFTWKAMKSFSLCDLIAGELHLFPPPYFKFMSNDLKCRDRWQGNSVTFKKKRIFPGKEWSPWWNCPTHCPKGALPFTPLRCFLHADQLRLDDSNMKWVLSLVKVLWPGGAGVGRCRRVLRGQSGPTVAWQQPVGTAVSTPVKVSLVWPCTPSSSIRS